MAGLTDRTVRRGDVWWADLDPARGGEIGKRRPVAVMGRNAINARRRTIIVVPLSSLLRVAPPLTVMVHCLRREATAAVDQVRALDKMRLVEFIETMAQDEVAAIRAALSEIL
jgi:mRNA interferase MazF